MTGHIQFGIHAPYSRCETTAAALRLAAVIRQQAWTVSWLTGSIHRPVSSLWDHDIRISRGPALKKWCQRCDIFAWFNTDDRIAMSAAKAWGRRDARHILVYDGLRVPDALLGCFGYFDTVICPNHAAAISLADAGVLPSKLKVCHWASGLPPARKQARSDSVLVYCDPGTWRRHGAAAAEIAVGISRHTDLKVSLIAGGAPDRSEARILREGWNNRPDHFSAASNVALDVLSACILEQDWFILLGVRHNFCLHAQQAVAANVPVFAWRSSPIDEIIVSGCNGVLVDAGTRRDSSGATAGFSVARMLDRCLPVLTQPGLLSHLREGCWMSATDTDIDSGFRRFWSGVLDFQLIPAA